MSTPPARKAPLPRLAELKREGTKIVMVTAYDAPGARFAEDAGVDVVLVGDTAAMVVLGYEGTTVPVTMDEMLFLTRTVVRAARRPIVVGDMPFGSYQVSDEDGGRERDPLRQGGRRGRGQARGRRAVALARRAIVQRRHPGDGPRRPDAAVGDDARRVQDAGQDCRGGGQLVEDALALEEAGCFAVVLEAVPAPVAAEITARLSVPTIGIGAGPACDGQVLVYHDLLGLYGGPPAALRQALREPAARDPRRARGYARRCARARSRRRSTPTRCRPRSSSSFESVIRRRVQRRHASSEHASAQASEGSPTPANAPSPAPRSEPPLRKTSSP